ncbi:MAG: DUF87 domain-containing protein, partial [Bdellovibrionales bacterium]|nr:DUF87 domain-containing protein [Bdellovibrionales bacterium]
IRSQISMILPDANLEVIQDYCDEWQREIENEQIEEGPNQCCIAYEIGNQSAQAAPYWNYLDRSMDLLLPAMNLLSLLPTDRKFIYQIVARPLKRTMWLNTHLRCSTLAWKLRSLVTPRLWCWPSRKEEFLKSKQRSERTLFGANIRFCILAKASSQNPNRTQSAIEEEAAQFYRCLKITTRSDLGGYRTRQICRSPIKALENFRVRQYANPFLLSDLDLTTAYHLVALGGCPFFSTSHTKKVFPVADLLPSLSPLTPTGGIGRLHNKEQELRFSFSDDLRKRHLHILGRTGMGKTKLLQLLVQEDYHRGHHGFIFDSTREFTSDFKQLAPNGRARLTSIRVHSEGPSGPTSLPFTMNLFRERNPHKLDRLAKELAKVIIQLSDTSKISERMASELSLIIQGLIQIECESFSDLQEFFTNDSFREDCLERMRQHSYLTKQTLLTKDSIRQGGLYECIARTVKALSGMYFDLPVKERDESEGSGEIGTCSIRDSFFRDQWEQRSMVLLNCPKSAMNTTVLVAFSAIFLAILHERESDQAHTKCRLYFDEFQEFASESLCRNITRQKSSIPCAIAHQCLSQLTPQLSELVASCFEQRICFQMGGEDAARALPWFHSKLQDRDITGLHHREFQASVKSPHGASAVLSGRTADLTTYPSETRPPTRDMGTGSYFHSSEPILQEAA